MREVEERTASMDARKSDINFSGAGTIVGRKIVPKTIVPRQLFPRQLFAGKLYALKIVRKNCLQKLVIVYTLLLKVQNINRTRCTVCTNRRSYH